LIAAMNSSVLAALDLAHALENLLAEIAFRLAHRSPE